MWGGKKKPLNFNLPFPKHKYTEKQFLVTPKLQGEIESDTQISENSWNYSHMAFSSMSLSRLALRTLTVWRYNSISLHKITLPRARFQILIVAFLCAKTVMSKLLSISFNTHFLNAENTPLGIRTLSGQYHVVIRIFFASPSQEKKRSTVQTLKG